MRDVASRESPDEMLEAPLFCVIVLVYNDLPHCLKAIESVLTQAEQDFELVVIDNGSTDQTTFEVQKYQSDPRVRVVRYPFNQRSEATQSVAAETKAKYLNFLFSDDVYLPRRLAKAKEIVTENPHFDYIFFNNVFADEFGNSIANEEVPPRTQYRGDVASYDRFGHLRYSLETGNTLHPCGMVVKTEVYNRLEGFPNTMHRIGDMAFFTRLLGACEGCFEKEPMQRITVWTKGKNESAANNFQDNEIGFERALILERWLEPGILDNLEKIFAYRQADGMKLQTRAERLWFLAQQVLKCGNPESQLFGFRLLHEASSIGGIEFAQCVIAMTGFTPCQYIQDRLRNGRVFNFYPPTSTGATQSVIEYKANKRHSLLFPAVVIREVGKLLSTIGFKTAGTTLWNLALDHGAGGG